MIQFACGVFIDLEMSFDTVNHQILLAKLEHYDGLRGVSDDWFRSNLGGTIWETMQNVF